MTTVRKWQLLLLPCISLRIDNNSCQAFSASRPSSAGPFREKSPAVVEDTPEFEAFLESNDGWGNFGTRISRDGASGRRGVYATTEFRAGDRLCCLPASAGIEIEDDETTEAERGLKYLRWRESDAARSWQPYLDLLPTRKDQFDPTPNFWSDGELRELELPEILEEVSQRKESLEALADEEGVDLGELNFASWIIASRTFSLVAQSEDESDGDSEENIQTICVMLPYIDMINHSSDRSNAEMSLDPESSQGLQYVLEATTDIAKGEEITISYGTGEDESIDLLLNYGFIPDENSFDVEFLEGDEYEWETSLEEDIKELEGATDLIRRTTLRTRIKLKLAMNGEGSIN